MKNKGVILMRNTDWDEFNEYATWFLYNKNEVAIDKTKAFGEVFKITQNFSTDFPKFSSLLRQARITPVLVDGKQYYVFGFTSLIGDSCGWLCLPPTVTERSDLHLDHRVLLTCFGGIVETWNGPVSWLSNLNFALCEEESSSGFNGMEEYIEEMCSDEGLVPFLNPNDYISFAVEANGNCTVYHKQSSSIMMVAPDHCFDNITRIEGYPDYTLYKMNDCENFKEWVELVANQWLNNTNCRDGHDIV
jgi:hypothetical protein